MKKITKIMPYFIMTLDLISNVIQIYGLFN